MGLRKPRSDAKLKTLPEDIQRKLFEWMSQPESGVREAAEYCETELGISVSPSTCSEFFDWYQIKQRWDKTDNLATQVTEELLKENPDLDMEDLVKVGQLIFTGEAIGSGDKKTFIALAKLQLEGKKHHLEIKKLEQRITEWEETAAKAKQDLEGIREDGGMSEAALAKLERVIKTL